MSSRYLEEGSLGSLQNAHYIWGCGVLQKPGSIEIIQLKGFSGIELFYANLSCSFAASKNYDQTEVGNIKELDNSEVTFFKISTITCNFRLHGPNSHSQGFKTIKLQMEH